MTIGERIRQIRKEKGLTLVEFASRIKISFGSVSKLEKGENNPADRTIALICREFHVNEEWLRTGAGTMEDAETRDDALADALERILTAGTDDFRKRLISALVRLPPEHWHVLEELADAIMRETPSVPPPTAGAAREWTREELHAELDRQLDAEKEAEERASASGRGNSGAGIA